MTNGMERFEYYLQQLEPLLLEAENNSNPAYWLYKHNARTPIFMLEGLAKLYTGLHNKKKFAKIKAHLKLLEDGLGRIDQYDFYATQLAKKPGIPPPIIDYQKKEVEVRCQLLNSLLKENGWIGKKKDRIKKIRKRLASAEWLDPQEEIRRIKEFYEDSISDIKVLVLSAEKGFTEMENEVHELRRKMRWLSIYPQALQGAVQLTVSALPDENVKSYLTPEIISSPYNKLPDAGNNRHFLLLEKDYFLALSWMINELGKLKDEGLMVHAIAEALEKTEGLTRSLALYKAGELEAGSQDTLKNILDQTNAICKNYFGEHHLEMLIHGTAEAKKPLKSEPKMKKQK